MGSRVLCNLPACLPTCLSHLLFAATLAPSVLFLEHVRRAVTSGPLLCHSAWSSLLHVCSWLASSPLSVSSQASLFSESFPDTPLNTPLVTPSAILICLLCTAILLYCRSPIVRYIYTFTTVHTIPLHTTFTTVYILLPLHHL